MNALTEDGLLYLSDDSAPFGDMVEIKLACRELGLSYRHWHEALEELGSQVEIWTPALSHPIVLTGNHCDYENFLVDGHEVSRALALIEHGRDAEAMALLHGLAPNLPELPAFELASEPNVPFLGVDDASIAQ